MMASVMHADCLDRNDATRCAAPASGRARTSDARHLSKVKQLCRASLSRGDVFVIVVDSDRVPVDADRLPLSFHDAARASSFARPVDRSTFLVGRLLLAEFMDPPISLLDLQIGTHGKPKICGSANFNISHSGSRVALALSSVAPLGVDLEMRAGFERFGATVERMCHVAEREQLRVLDQQSAAECRQRIWTRKEAVLKAKGTGLRADLRMVNTRAEIPSGTAVHVSGLDVLTIDSPKRDWVLSIAYEPPVDRVSIVSLNDAMRRTIAVGADRRRGARVLSPRGPTSRRSANVDGSH